MVANSGPLPVARHAGGCTRSTWNTRTLMMKPKPTQGQNISQKREERSYSHFINEAPRGEETCLRSRNSPAGASKLSTRATGHRENHRCGWEVPTRSCCAVSLHFPLPLLVPLFSRWCWASTTAQKHKKHNITLEGTGRQTWVGFQNTLRLWTHGACECSLLSLWE